MIYLVTNKLELFESNLYKIITVEESISMMNPCQMLQVDTETDGRDCHINKLLCVQFGSKKYDFQIVVDCSIIDISQYKEILETKGLILQNAKFDLQFFYSNNIIPRKIYDTMIVEQVLYLGFPYNPITPEEYRKYNYDFPYLEHIDIKTGKTFYTLSFSLQALGKKYLNIDIDKSTRGEIIWRGLDSQVILYAAGDVTYLEDIMNKQLVSLKEKKCLKAAQLECGFIPTISYLEWCGIKLDVNKWKDKMNNDYECLQKAEDDLNSFVVNTPSLQSFVYYDLQGSLWDGFDSKPKININWSSSSQVVKVAKILGFDTKVQDKKTGEDKDSVIEKHLKKQKGINDEFLKLYFNYQEYAKVVSSFGQGHLDAINPITNRIHTQYKQLGADTGRMSCGSTKSNDDLAKYKKLPKGSCKYPNMQQLPHDEVTRSCFVADNNNYWVSCDYAAIESRLGGDIYKEQSIIDEFLYGSGDMHSLVAKMIFKELADVPVSDIKKKYPHLRNAAKPVEFSQQFGGSAFAIQNSMGCSLEEAQYFADAYMKGFPGIAKFKEKGAKNVREYGFIELCPITGHKTYWWDFNKWKERQSSFTQEFWEDYREHHKGTLSPVALEVKEHFQAVSKWERKALNSVTQGTGAIILKDSQISVFNWIVNNGYFGLIRLCNLTHDEANWEYPKEVEKFPSLLKEEMEKSASKYCHSLPIPAEYSIGDFWIH